MNSINKINGLVNTPFKYINFLIKDKIYLKNRPFLRVLDKNSMNSYLLRFCHSNQNSNIIESDSDSEYSDESILRKELNSDRRRVAKTFREHRLQQRLEVEQPQMPKLARVVLIGSPNAGKSTLINELVGRKISSVSSKVHTTRHKVIGVIVEDDTQVEFLDTPGLVSHLHCSRHKLEPTFISDPLAGAEGADIIAVISDVSNNRERDRLNAGVIRLLDKYSDKESVLILNKIDRIREKRKLLDITTRLTCGVVGGIISVKTQKVVISDSKRGLEKIFAKTEEKLNKDFKIKSESNVLNEDIIEERIGWNRFSHVFMTSALTGDGIEDIRQYLLSKAKFRPWIYHRSQITDQSPQELVKTTIREKFLDRLREEIPYKLNFVVTMWHLDESGNIFISVDVLCPQKFQSLVIGPKGQTIASIVQEVRESLSNTFYCDISIKLIVKGVKSK